MNRAEALAAIESERISERLEGARNLARLALPEDRGFLEVRRRSEPVPWIRNALGRAVARACVPATERLPEANLSPNRLPIKGRPEESLAEASYAAALQEASDRFVHELRKPLGRARHYAELEVENFESSRTYHELRRVQQFLDGIQALGVAAGAAALSEFRLPDLLVEEVSAVSDQAAAVSVDLQGPDDLVVIADPALLRLVVTNALQNAVEAAIEVGSTEPIVVSWGDTNSDYYVVILDRGPGVPASIEGLFEIGTTSKRGHIGMGLAIARQASRSLGGTSSIENLPDGLTRFELRWPKEERG